MTAVSTGGLFFLLSLDLLAAQQAVYTLIPEASGRGLGMGGASTALSDNASGVFSNPAGLAFGRWDFDFDLTQTRSSNEQIRSVYSKDKSQPVDFFGGALTYKLGVWAIGLGVHAPYALHLKEGYQEARWNRQGVAIVLSRQITKRLALGVSYQLQTLDQSYSDSDTGERGSESSTSDFYKLGLSYRANRSGVGLFYAPGYRFNFDNPRGENLSFTFFEEAVVPAQWGVGLFHQLHLDLLLAVDLRVFLPQSEALYPGSIGDRFNGGSLASVDQQTEVLHGGLEWMLSRSKSTEVTLRLGAYNEPRQFVPDPHRLHFTYALDVRFGPAKVSVSFDQAEDFTNTSQGVSIAIGEI